MSKQEKIDYSEINAIEASANISPIDDSKEFTLETELQRLLHYIKHIAINIENPEEYNKQIHQANEILFNFNAGLLCGLKMAKKANKLIKEKEAV